MKKRNSHKDMGIVRDYFIKQANTLDSQYDSSAIKGQPGDTGTNREEILQSWLLTHIPKRVSAEFGGQIIDSERNVSGQVDIVIYDDVTPLFGAHKKQYFFAEGVAMAIQVKSKLNSKELAASVKNLATVKKCKIHYGGRMFIGDMDKKEITTGVFAFDTSYKSHSSLIKALNRLLKQGLPPVDFVCINKKVYISYNYGSWRDKEGKVLPRGYLMLDNREGSIWRMVIRIADETKRILFASVDFQRYFF